MFKLELTDGQNTAYAMEYVTIPKLNSKISPGVKLKIIGPLQVVNHIMLIGPQNLELIGGDVDHLLVVNAYENVLLRALDKPTTDTPMRDYNDEVPATTNHRDINNIPMRAPENNHNANNRAAAENLLEGIDFDEEEDVDADMLMQIEQEERRNRSNEGSRNGSNQQQHPIVDIDVDDDIAAQMDIDSIANVAQHSVAQIIEIREPSRISAIRANDLLIPPIQIPDDDDGYEDLQVPTSNTRQAHNSCEYTQDIVPRKIARVEPTRVIKVSDDNYKFKSSNGDNMVTIDQYIALKTSEKMKRDYVVRATVDVTKNTLRIKDNQWILYAELTDSYSHQCLSTKFHNKILEKLSGSTGVEMQLMYREATTRPHLKKDIMNIVNELWKKLNALYCFMKIEMNVSASLQNNCEVVELLEKISENDQKYKMKLKEESLTEVE